MTPSPARTTLRFSVQNPAGQRAATWKCWAPSTTDDVYLACREVGGTFKISLHQSGEWNTAFTPSFYDRAVRDEDTTARGRFLDQWTRPSPIAPGVTLALRIVTPWSSVATPVIPSRRLVTIPAPADARAVETIIFLLDPRVSPEGWPGRDLMNTKLVGAFPLASGGHVSVVSWEIAMPTIPPLQATPRFVRGATMADLRAAEGLHMLALGDHVDGSKVIFDCVARHQESTAAGHAQAPA
jgi:hypothetical protein